MKVSCRDFWNMTATVWNLTTTLWNRTRRRFIRKTVEDLIDRNVDNIKTEGPTRLRGLFHSILEYDGISACLPTFISDKVEWRLKGPWRRYQSKMKRFIRAMKNLTLEHTNTVWSRVCTVILCYRWEFAALAGRHDVPSSIRFLQKLLEYRLENLFGNDDDGDIIIGQAGSSPPLPLYADRHILGPMVIFARQFFDFSNAICTRAPDWIPEVVSILSFFLPLFISFLRSRGDYGDFGVPNPPQKWRTKAKQKKTRYWRPRQMSNESVSNFFSKSQKNSIRNWANVIRTTQNIRLPVVHWKVYENRVN